MASRDLMDAFNDCINRVNSGQTVEDCLHIYPQFAEQLRPMLEAGHLVERAQFTLPEAVDARTRVRFRFERALEAQPRTVRRQPGSYRRLAGIAASLILVFIVVLGGASVAAQSAVPGDSLYGIKRLTEDVRLLISGNDTELQAQFNHRRIDETRDLLQQGRAQEVTFRGNVQSLSDDIAVIEGLDVRMDGLDRAGLNLAVGLQVEVTARTTPANTLQAIRIRAIGSTNLDAPVPGPSATLTPASTPTVTPVPPTVTETPSPTSTMMPQPMRTPVTPAPTRTTGPSRTPAPSNTPRSSGTPQPEPTELVCMVSPPSGWITYEVRSGDTLFDLAIRANTTVDRIRRVNCLREDEVLRVGQIIYLPTGSAGNTPTVTPGRDNSGPGGGDIDRPEPTDDESGNGGDGRGDGRNGD